MLVPSHHCLPPLEGLSFFSIHRGTMMSLTDPFTNIYLFLLFIPVLVMDQHFKEQQKVETRQIIHRT